MSIVVKRKELGLTQIKLAEKIGVSPSTVAMWETGYRTPRADKLIQLSKIFNCTIDELLKKEAEDE